MFISPLTLKNNSFKIQVLQIVLVTTLKKINLYVKCIWYLISIPLFFATDQQNIKKDLSFIVRQLYLDFYPRVQYK